MADTEKSRNRTYVAVLYPEDPSHAAAMEKLKSNGYTYAAILHDQDVYEDGENKGELKKPHWHLVIKFPNAVWNTSLAKDLGITPNYLEKCKNLDSALLYLVHYGYEDTKFQYDVENVFGPLQRKLIALLQDTDEGTRALQIVDIVENCPGKVSYSELLKKACAAGLYSDLRRMGTFAVYLVREHNDEYDYVDYRQHAGTRKDAEKFKDFAAFTGDKGIKPL